MTTSRSGTHESHPTPPASDDPLAHADRDVMVPSSSAPLDEQGPLLDEDGDGLVPHQDQPT